MYPNNTMMNQSPGQNYYPGNGQIYQQPIPMQQQEYPMQVNSPYQYVVPPNQFPAYQEPQPQPYYGQHANFVHPQPQAQPVISIQMGNNIMGQDRGPILMEQPRPEDGRHLPSHVKSKITREIKCSVCQRRGFTNTKHVIGTGAWTIGLALFCCGCWPCACIPCCMQDCMDVQHNCPNCGAECGTNRYLFDD